MSDAPSASGGKAAPESLLPEQPLTGPQETYPSRGPGTIRALQASVELTYAGPLPHPAILQQYESVLPGTAERIVRAFEKQSEHRQSIERRVIFSNAKSQLIGTISGSVMGIVGVCGGLWLAHEGKDFTGLVAMLGTLSSLVGLFLSQRKRQDKELANKEV